LLNGLFSDTQNLIFERLWIRNDPPLIVRRLLPVTLGNQMRNDTLQSSFVKAIVFFQPSKLVAIAVAKVSA